MSTDLLDMYKKTSDHQNGNSSDKELIDISSDDESSKVEENPPKRMKKSTSDPKQKRITEPLSSIYTPEVQVTKILQKTHTCVFHPSENNAKYLHFRFRSWNPTFRYWKNPWSVKWPNRWTPSPKRNAISWRQCHRWPLPTSEGTQKSWPIFARRSCTSYATSFIRTWGYRHHEDFCCTDHPGVAKLFWLMPSEV